LPARSEVKIVARFQQFTHEYFMDMLFSNGLMVEAKTVETLTKSHVAQTINYLLLTGMHDGLLVNLRRDRVEKKFISTTLNLYQRRQFSLCDEGWITTSEASDRWRQLTIDLLSDWGTFLEINLYRNALVELLNGADPVRRRIPIFDGNTEMGTQEVCLLDPETAFVVTGLKSGLSAMEHHFQQFLNHTALARLQWVNMNNHLIEFRTIVR